MSATVGIILHLIERRAGILGRIATSFIGIAWSLATFFVVPVLILENKGVARLGEGVRLTHQKDLG
jgi:hypothetical protein